MVVLIKEGIVKDIIAASPPLAVTGMNFMGYPISDWAALMSIVWVLILMFLRLKEVIGKRFK